MENAPPYFLRRLSIAFAWVWLSAARARTPFSKQSRELKGGLGINIFDRHGLPERSLVLNVMACDHGSARSSPSHMMDQLRELAEAEPLQALCDQYALRQILFRQPEDRHRLHRS